MTAQVILTPEARADLAEAAAWYRELSIRAAEEFLLAVSVAFARIEAQPTAQVVVDADTGARRALLRKFPHRVLYLIDGGRLVVFAVMSHHRDDPAWRERLSEQKSSDPLHGVTLERVLTELSAQFGWEELGRRVPIRCFQFDPSVKSSLAFLRKTPWARAKVEDIYVRWKLTGS